MDDILIAAELPAGIGFLVSADIASSFQFIYSGAYRVLGSEGFPALPLVAALV